MFKNLLNSFLEGDKNRSAKSTIIRVQYGRLGQVLVARVKISSGDQDFDRRGVEHVKKTTHPDLHHPNKRKSIRPSQWYEIRYTE